MGLGGSVFDFFQVDLPNKTQSVFLPTYILCFR